MTYAGIKNGIVVRIFTPIAEMEEYEPGELFAPDLTDEWVKIDGLNPQPQSGWTYDGTTFAEPPPIESGEPRLEWARKLGYRV